MASPDTSGAITGVVRRERVEGLTVGVVNTVRRLEGVVSGCGEAVTL